MAKQVQHNSPFSKKLRRLQFCGPFFVFLIITSAGNAQRFGRLPLFTSEFASQTQDDNVRISAEHLYDEGRRLFATGTSDSMLRAVEKFEESLTLWRKLGDRLAEASTLGFIGNIYDALGEQQKALDCYDDALPILREVGAKRSEANTLNNIGLIHDARGDKRGALEFYEKALTVLGQVKEPGVEGITLVNIGLAYDGLGEKQKALNYYQRALSILRSAGDRASEAVTLNNIGRVYDSLGEKQKALDYFGQALPILNALGNGRLAAITLNNIAYVHDSLQEKQKALDYYRQALPVLRTVGDRYKEAVTINNLGLIYRSQGQFTTALDYFTQALKLRRTIGDRPGEAETLGDLGMVYASMRDTRKALDSYNESLRLSRLVEDRRVEASTLLRIAVVESERGRLVEARSMMESSLAIVENLRTRITGQELRASYFATVHEHFERYIALLMRMHRMNPSKGYDSLALKTSERARARSMLEMLSEAKADIREGVAPSLLEREHLLQQELRESGEKQTRFFEERKSDDQLATLRRETANLLSEYQQLEAEIRIASPRYAALTQPVPLSVNEIQQQTLDQDTLLLEFSLGDKKSFLWAVTPTTLKSFELPPRAEIEKAGRLVCNLLTARNQQVKFETPQEKAARVERADKDYLDAAVRLSNMLLGPVERQLGTKRLLIVGDGVLDFIPFGALPIANKQATGKYQPLILDHEIISLPSASTLAVLRREVAGRGDAEKTLAVVADPVFAKDDPRFKSTTNDKKSETRSAINAHVINRGGQSRANPPFINLITSAQKDSQIQRLPFTRLEADQILALVPASESMRAVDFDANHELATSPELGKYRYIHFATHGILNSQDPELSGIVLSLFNREGMDQDGFLWAHEVFNLHLPVEMVVLSGCQTGLGKEIRGEGLVGLTRGFMYAGAKRVVVSLWDISDEASAELMAQFYKGLLGKDQLRPAAALRAAQITVWSDRRWQAPYYWAAFVIQGETN